MIHNTWSIIHDILYMIYNLKNTCRKITPTPWIFNEKNWQVPSDPWHLSSYFWPLHLLSDMKCLKWFIRPQIHGFMGVSDAIFCNAPVNAITDLSEDWGHHAVPWQHIRCRLQPVIYGESSSMFLSWRFLLPCLIISVNLTSSSGSKLFVGKC